MLLHNCSMNAMLELESQWWNICRLWLKVLLHVYFAPMVTALSVQLWFYPARNVWLQALLGSLRCRWSREQDNLCKFSVFNYARPLPTQQKTCRKKKRSKVRDLTGFDTWYSTFPSNCAVCMSFICVSKGSVFRGDGIGDVRRPLYLRHWACPCSGCSWWGRLDGSRAASIPRL